jgi:hypothetical protein
LFIVFPDPIEQDVQGKDGNFKLIYYAQRNRELSVFQKQKENGYSSHSPPELKFDITTSSAWVREEGSAPKYRWQANEAVDVCNSEIETRFWTSLGNGSPLYGADVEGSCFDNVIPFNFTQIKSTLKQGLKNQQIMGVTTPYLYVGSWRSMFGWHKEDMDLYSINYLHAGYPKFWYSVDLRDNKKFEEYVHSTFEDDFRECTEFIRHKNTLINPSNLMQIGIRLKK